MQNQPQEAVPNPVGNRAGWYPRWWLLAAFVCSLAIGIVRALWTPLICPPHTTQAQAFVCRVTTWPSIPQILLVWLVFVLVWWVISIFGVRSVEIPSVGVNALGLILETLTRFASLNSLLYIQGCIALVIINVLWWLNTTPPLAFALLGIVVFLAHCTLFYSSTQEERRQYTIAYGILAVLNFLFQLFFRSNLFFPNVNISQAQWPLLFSEFLFLIIGTAALFYRPRQGQQTQEQARNTMINQTASPGGILRNMGLFRRLFPRRPPQGNQPPPGPGPQAPGGQGNIPRRNNPDPGAP